MQTSVSRSRRPAPLRTRISDEVSEALRDGRPVLALESNVVAQGLPYPVNLQMAAEVEQIARDLGAVPATTAILSGEVVVGLTMDELAGLARDPGTAKLSARDLGVFAARSGTGATTIAATMAIADLVGIPVVASAGLGGVHRGVAQTMDVSADLMQLTRSRVLLVCAGAKKILDLPKTLEYLETAGIPVVAYRSDDFPAFYCTSSGIPAPHRVDDPAEIAALARAHWAYGGSGSVLVTHPIPEHEALPTAEVERAITAALDAASRDGITGQKVTRYLLDAVDRATNGRASAANAGVLRSTTAAAAEIAIAYANTMTRVRS